MAREREISGLAAGGLSDADIASRLAISVRTVETHPSRSCHKLGVAVRHRLASALGTGFLAGLKARDSGRPPKLHLPAGPEPQRPRSVLRPPDAVGVSTDDMDLTWQRP